MYEKLSIISNTIALFWWIYYTWDLSVIFNSKNLIRKATECNFCTAFWSSIIAMGIYLLDPESSLILGYGSLPFTMAFLISKITQNDTYTKR